MKLTFSLSRMRKPTQRSYNLSNRAFRKRIMSAGNISAKAAQSTVVMCRAEVVGESHNASVKKPRVHRNELGIIKLRSTQRLTYRRMEYFSRYFEVYFLYWCEMDASPVSVLSRRVPQRDFYFQLFPTTLAVIHVSQVNVAFCA